MNRSLSTKHRQSENLAKFLKNLANKVKMDNGIELIVPLDVYRNGDLIEFVNNPDGTVSIMLKYRKISNQL